MYSACRCDVLSPSIDSARSIGWFDGWVRNSVILLKYSEERARAAHLGQLMAGQVADLPRHDVIIPVPLHKRRENNRGFNQSMELSEAISHATAIPIDAALLHRSIDTTPQVGLARHLRQDNVRGAFALVRSRADEHTSALIVDDVFTTGATVAEVARVLKSAGFLRVDVVTAARADHHHAG